jgi:DHA2 family multidrug resistance protein
VNEPAAHAPARNPWIAAVAVMSSAIMEVIDTSVVNVSLPHIAGSLSATTDEATWVLTSYIVANAIILPISGWLANYFGRKRLLMSVVTGFTVSSVLCGFALNLPMLVFFRVMQGITGGGLQPLSQAVLLEEFPPERRGTAMAFWGLGIIAAPILGPTLGGWITDNYSWRWVFYINLPIGILSLGLIYLFIVDPPYLRRGTARVDAIGIGLLALGIASFQVLLDKGQEADWFASVFMRVLAVTAVVTLVAFVIRELKTAQPLVDFRLLRFRTFSAGVTVAAALGFVLYGSLVLLPLFMQSLLGFTAETAGFWSSPRGIGTAVMMPLTGYLLGRRWDARLLLSIGLVVASVAFFNYSHLSLAAGPTDFLMPQIVQGIGMALVFVPLTTITMDPIPLPSMGYATSIYSLMRNIGSSIGISFVTTMLARRSQLHQSRLVESITPYSTDAANWLHSVAGAVGTSGSDPQSAANTALAAIYAVAQRQAALLSFLDLFHLLGIMFLVTVPLVWIMKRPRAGRGAAGAVH